VGYTEWDQDTHYNEYGGDDNGIDVATQHAIRDDGKCLVANLCGRECHDSTTVVNEEEDETDHVGEQEGDEKQMTILADGEDLVSGCLLLWTTGLGQDGELSCLCGEDQTMRSSDSATVRYVRPGTCIQE
jgi:hypothetical protein